MQKIIMAKPLEALIAEKAKQRMLSTLKKGEDPPLAPKEASGKTSEIIGFRRILKMIKTYLSGLIKINPNLKHIMCLT